MKISSGTFRACSPHAASPDPSAGTSRSAAPRSTTTGTAEPCPGPQARAPSPSGERQRPCKRVHAAPDGLGVPAHNARRGGRLNRRQAGGPLVKGARRQSEAGRNRPAREPPAGVHRSTVMAVPAPITRQGAPASSRAPSAHSSGRAHATGLAHQGGIGTGRSLPKTSGPGTARRLQSRASASSAPGQTELATHRRGPAGRRSPQAASDSASRSGSVPAGRVAIRKRIRHSAAAPTAHLTAVLPTSKAIRVTCCSKALIPRKQARVEYSRRGRRCAKGVGASPAAPLP